MEDNHAACQRWASLGGLTRWRGGRLGFDPSADAYEDDADSTVDAFPARVPGIFPASVLRRPVHRLIGEFGIRASQSCGRAVDARGPAAFDGLLAGMAFIPTPNFDTMSGLVPIVSHGARLHAVTAIGAADIGSVDALDDNVAAAA